MSVAQDEVASKDDVKRLDGRIDRLSDRIERLSTNQLRSTLALAALIVAVNRGG